MKTDDSILGLKKKCMTIPFFNKRSRRLTWNAPAEIFISCKIKTDNNNCSQNKNHIKLQLIQDMLSKKYWGITQDKLDNLQNNYKKYNIIMSRDRDNVVIQVKL